MGLGTLAARQFLAPDDLGALMTGARRSRLCLPTAC